MNTQKITTALLCFATASVIFISCSKPTPVPESATPSTERISQMIKDWERAKRYTQAYLDSSNERSVAFKASDKAPRTFGDQLLHISEANYGLAQAATGKATELGFGKMEKSDLYKTKADVANATMASYDFMISALKEMNDGQLKDSCSVFNMTMTKEQLLNKAFEHQTHHRGQCAIYLRAQGLTPPQEMLF